MKKYRKMLMGLGLMLCLTGCNMNAVLPDGAQSQQDGSTVDNSSDKQEDAEAASGHQNQGTYEDFLAGKICAVGTFEGSEYEIWFNELPQDPNEWDSYSVSDEKLDLDNDGKEELILNGPYGGMYIDERDGAVFVLAQGEGTTGELGHVDYECSTYITHGDVSHGGRKCYWFDRYDGSGAVVDTFELKAEYYDNTFDQYSLESDFYFKGKKITMFKYEQLMKEIFGQPTREEAARAIYDQEMSVKDETNPILENVWSNEEFAKALDGFDGTYTYKYATDGSKGTIDIGRKGYSEFYNYTDMTKEGRRFYAAQSSVQYIQGNKLYLKEYTSDETVEPRSFIIIDHDDYIFVCETDSNFENPQFLYTAWLKF